MKNFDFTKIEQISSRGAVGMRQKKWNQEMDKNFKHHSLIWIWLKYRILWCSLV